MNRTASSPLVVGVTGHRVVTDVDRILAGVSEIADRLGQRNPGRPITILSSLAEGSDRIVARYFLDRGARLIVPLPLPAAEFVKDFRTAESRREFAELLARASQQVVMPGAPSRDDAYLGAGVYVLDHCEAIVAVWDGRPPQGRAGTGVIVGIARERNLPLAWIAAGNRRDGTEEPTSLGPQQGRVTFERFEAAYPSMDRRDPEQITGDIPYRIRIGVVGDAPAENLDSLRTAVQTGFVEKLNGLFNPRSRHLLCLDGGPEKELLTQLRYSVLVCPLAAGERALAEQVAGFPDTRVQVVLPAAPSEFLGSVHPGVARDEARRLIDKTRVVIVRSPDESRLHPSAAAPPAATHAVDRFIVDHCDALIVLPGDQDHRIQRVLALARSRKRPLVILSGQPNPAWTVEEGHGLDARSVVRLEMFNRFPVSASAQEAYVSNQLKEVLGEVNGGSIPEESIARVREYLLPWYVRASLLAKRSQRLYQRAGTAVWVLFPAAVTAVAVGALVPRLAPVAYGLEFALLAAIAGIVWYADRKRSHEVWIECRFLTERIRAATYLAACGCETAATRITPNRGNPSQRDEWMMMAFDEIWGRMPALSECSADTCDALARFAQRRWVRRQIEFHEQKAAGARRVSRRLEQWGRVAFVLAVAIAGVHVAMSALGYEHHLAPSTWLTFLAIALPATGAALGGFRSHREYSRLAKRSANMLHELQRLDERLSDAATPQALHRGLREAEDIMLAETQDWLMLMQTLPVELPG